MLTFSSSDAVKMHHLMQQRAAFRRHRAEIDAFALAQIASVVRGPELFEPRLDEEFGTGTDDERRDVLIVQRVGARERIFALRGAGRAGVASFLVWDVLARDSQRLVGQDEVAGVLEDGCGRSRACVSDGSTFGDIILERYWERTGSHALFTKSLCAPKDPKNQADMALLRAG